MMCVGLVFCFLVILIETEKEGEKIKIEKQRERICMIHICRAHAVKTCRSHDLVCSISLPSTVTNQ